MMVEAVTLENYVKFFTDPYYTDIFWTTLRVALLCTLVCLRAGAFRWPTCWRARESRYKNVLIMLVVLPLFVGNAVRAAGWMTLFGSKGFAQRRADETRPDRRAAADHVHREGRDHRHHRRQPALHGADAAERARGHRPRNLEEAAFSLGAGPWTMFRRVLLAAGAARHHRRRHPVLHPRHERLCDARAARRPASSR